MTYARYDHIDDFDTLPRVPSWVTSARAAILENVAFLSGVALSHLHLVLNHADVPQGLLHERLALRAAEACAARTGRTERAVSVKAPGRALTTVEPRQIALLVWKAVW